MSRILIGFFIIFLVSYSADSENFFKKLEKDLKEKIKKETANIQNREYPNPNENQNESAENYKNQGKYDSDTTSVLNENYSNDKTGGLLDIGKKFGVNEKTLDIINSGFGVIKSQQEITYEEENDIGGSLALEVLQRYNGNYNNDIINLYVNLVGQSVAKYSDNSELNFKFLVLNSNEINAFAAPGGYVFITKGLFKILQDESQLASVLAHEIAHVTNRHILQSLQRGKFFENLTKLAAAASKKNTGKYTAIMNEVNKILFEKGVDKSMEYEADAIGIEFAARTGYNPGGLLEFLKNLNSYIGKSKSIFFSTHPSVFDRINKINEILSSNYTLQSGMILKDRFLSYKKFVK
ncbi:M48 family metalloprotease [Candidatus Dependentiae bacterium]|nr:M48 family metalloprotease [Candidatus Dependentiae bacterium]